MSYRIIKFALWKFCQMLTVKQKENRRISDILRHKKKNGLILQTVSSFFQFNYFLKKSGILIDCSLTPPVVDLGCSVGIVPPCGLTVDV